MLCKSDATNSQRERVQLIILFFHVVQLNNASLVDLFQPVHEQILDTFLAEPEVPEPVVRQGPPRFMTEEWLNDIEKRGHDWLKKKFSTAEPVQIDDDTEERKEEVDDGVIELLDVKALLVDPVVPVPTCAPEVISPIILKEKEQEAAAISLMGKLTMTPVYKHDTRLKPRSMKITERAKKSQALVVKTVEQPRIGSLSTSKPRGQDRASVLNIKKWREEVEVKTAKSLAFNPSAVVQSAPSTKSELPIQKPAMKQINDGEELKSAGACQTSLDLSASKSRADQVGPQMCAAPEDINSVKFNHYIRPHGTSNKRVRSAVEPVRLADNAPAAKPITSPRSRSMPISQSIQSRQSALVASSPSSTMVNPSGTGVSLDIDQVRVEKVLAQTAFQVNTLRPTVSRDRPDTSSWTQLPVETSGFAKIFKSKPDPYHVPKLWKRKTLNAYLFQVYEMNKDTDPNDQYRYLHTPPVPRRNSDIPPEASIKDKMIAINKQGRPEPTPVQQPQRTAPREEIPLVRVPARGDSNATVEQLRRESQGSSNLSLRAASGSIRGKPFSKTWQTSRTSFSRLVSIGSSPRQPSYDFIDSYCAPKVETVDARTGKYLAKGRAIKRTNSMIIRGKPTWIDRSKIKRNKDLAVEAARFDSFFSFKKLAIWKSSKRDNQKTSPSTGLKTEVDLPCLPILSPGFTESPTTTGFSTPSTATDSWTASFKNSPVSIPALEDLIEEHIASEMQRDARREAMYITADRRVPLYL